MSPRFPLSLREFLRKWWPFLVPAAAAIWTVTTALVTAWWAVQQNRGESDRFIAQLRAEQQARTDAREDADLARRVEAQTPFLQKQLELYFEAVKVTGKLVDPALKKDDPLWKENVARFWELRWAELEMSGDEGVRQAMRRIQEQIIETEFDQSRNRHDLRWAVECLADELRLSLEHAWGIKRDPNRATASGVPVSKLPNGCASGDINHEVLPGMLPLKAPGNLVHLNAPGAR
jgi:hypothetical protein